MMYYLAEQLMGTLEFGYLPLGNFGGAN